MSGSPEYSEFIFRKAGKLPEKPNFTQTCSMLSQYLKERGSFGDLSLGMACNADTVDFTTEASCTPTTMSLFPINDKPAEDTISRDMASSRKTNSMNLFPQQSGFSLSAPKEDSLKTSDRSVMNPVKKVPQASQMTIFYNGEVTVFNDFPADKAKEIMLIASKGSTQTYSSVNANLVKSQTSAFATTTTTTTNHIQSRLPAPPTPTSTPKFVNNRTQGRTQALPETYAYDMPQARNASIHRFLERRKDRNTAKVPYQKNSQATSSYNPAESKPWFGLATVQSP